MQNNDKSGMEMQDLGVLCRDIKELKTWVANLQQTVNQIHYMIDQEVNKDELPSEEAD